MGKVLSRKLEMAFIDTDQWIEHQEGRCIGEIVSRHGWETFRALEARALRRRCTEDGLGIATGGGVVLDTQNVMCLKRSGRVVWLEAEPETIRRRMLEEEKGALTRPTLTGLDPAKEIERVLSDRTPLYLQASDFRIDTTLLKVEEVADRIAARIMMERMA